MEAELERHPSLDERFDPAMRIVDYDPEWPREFQREAQAIRNALGDLAGHIEHVGSTAVPGLPAKPIIDIQVSVEKIEPREAYVRPLERLGYLFAYDPDSPDYHFFGKPAAQPRRFHVHVCEVGIRHAERHVAVRDFLRAHPNEAQRYVALKRVWWRSRLATASPTWRERHRSWQPWSGVQWNGGLPDAAAECYLAQRIGRPIPHSSN